MPPEPIEPLTEEYAAVGPIKPCAQQQVLYGNLLDIRYDEDCLYLDVWTPEGANPGTLPDQPLPVIVSSYLYATQLIMYFTKKILIIVFLLKVLNIRVLKYFNVILSVLHSRRLLDQRLRRRVL
jgi:hypothetical protein